MKNIAFKQAECVKYTIINASANSGQPISEQIPSTIVLALSTFRFIRFSNPTLHTTFSPKIPNNSSIVLKSSQTIPVFHPTCWINVVTFHQTLLSSDSAYATTLQKHLRAFYACPNMKCWMKRLNTPNVDAQMLDDPT